MIRSGDGTGERRGKLRLGAEGQRAEGAGEFVRCGPGMLQDGEDGGGGFGIAGERNERREAGIVVGGEEGCEIGAGGGLRGCSVCPATGSSMKNEAPAPFLDESQMRPPCSCTMA